MMGLIPFLYIVKEGTLYKKGIQILCCCAALIAPVMRVWVERKEK
jgi:hypothetical protein